MRCPQLQVCLGSCPLVRALTNPGPCALDRLDVLCSAFAPPEDGSVCLGGTAEAVWVALLTHEQLRRQREQRAKNQRSRHVPPHAAPMFGEAGMGTPPAGGDDDWGGGGDDGGFDYTDVGGEALGGGDMAGRSQSSEWSQHCD